MPVDSAILQALGLDASDAKQASHGGSGFSSTFKLTGVKDGRHVSYFVKTGAGPAAATMFEGEHASLNAIHHAVPHFCPRSHAHGPLADADADTFFLATDFLDLGARAGSAGAQGSGLSFAQKLARLHTTPAPAPAGFDRPVFGFPVPTCCGATEQDNSWRDSWADFYADNRLRAVGRACARANGRDADFEHALETVAAKVAPRLIGAVRDMTPVLVHGDLWSGNHSQGVLAGQGGVEEVVFDPSAVYGHSEYELGIMRMFGGFGAGFWKEYEKLVPKAEPVDEWEDRVRLYELCVLCPTPLPTLPILASQTDRHTRCQISSPQPLCHVRERLPVRRHVHYEEAHLEIWVRAIRVIDGQHWILNVSFRHGVRPVGGQH